MTTEPQGSAAGDGAGAAAAAIVAGTAGSPAGTNGAGAAPNGSGSGGAADPFSGLETGSREWVAKSGAKDVATLVKNAMNSEALIGKSVQLPDDKAKPEEWDRVYNRLGRPEKADGYEFKLPDSAPKDMPYDGEFATSFKPVAHQLGLTAKQAAGVHDYYVGKAAGFYTSQAEAAGKRADAATDALEAKWGKSDSEQFATHNGNAFRALKGLGIEADLKAAGLLGELNGKPVVTNAPIALALADIGAKLFKEGDLPQGQGGGSADNPFKDGPDKGNQTAMMQAIKADKAGAIRLIRAAGFKPTDWNLTE